MTHVVVYASFYLILYTIPIPIAPNKHDQNGQFLAANISKKGPESGSCDRSCDSNMLFRSTKHKNLFAIKLHYTLCMYMHRSTLVYIYIYPPITHFFLLGYIYIYVYLYIGGVILSSLLYRLLQLYIYIYTSVLLCIYMHRLQWSLIAKQPECLVAPISMLLSQILSQLRPQVSSTSYIFEIIGMGIMSSSRISRRV